MSDFNPDVVAEFGRRQKILDLIRSSPDNLTAAMIHYKTNPVDFINDWGITYDPRLSVKTVPFIMFPRQKEYIIWLNNLYMNRSDGLAEKSRDMGLTWLCCAYACWLFLFHNDTAIAFGSRKEDLVDKIGDPKSIFEKIRFFIRNLPVEFRPEQWDEGKHARMLKITNPDNGSTITGEAGDNIGRGGRSSIYFKDEAAFYDRPELIEAAVSQNSDVKIDVSTPNGVGNPFYQKRVSGKIPVFTFHWRDDPRKDDAWYEKQKNILDPVVLAQEIDINYHASINNAFIDSDFVEKAMNTRKTAVEPHGCRVFGVDVARYGNDRSSVAYREGRIVHWIDRWNNMDTMQTAGKVRALIEEFMPDAVHVDCDGLGAGVFDRLREWYGDMIVPVHSGSSAANKTRYRNMRSEMWGKMKDWMKDGPVSLPHSQELKVDLTGLSYDINSNGQICLESKDDAKKRGVRSPDLGDSLALTFAYPVISRENVYNSSNEYLNTGYNY